VADDPPRHGGTLRAVCAELEGLGVPRGSLVLYVATFGAELPAPLRGYQAIPLAWPDWSVHDRLRHHAAETLAELLGTPVHEVRRVDPETPERGHVRARFEARDAAGRVH